MVEKSTLNNLATVLLVIGVILAIMGYYFYVQTQEAQSANPIYVNSNGTQVQPYSSSTVSGTVWTGIILVIIGIVLYFVPGTHYNNRRKEFVEEQLNDIHQHQHNFHNQETQGWY